MGHCLDVRYWDDPITQRRYVIFSKSPTNPFPALVMPSDKEIHHLWTHLNGVQSDVYLALSLEHLNYIKQSTVNLNRFLIAPAKAFSNGLPGVPVGQNLDAQPSWAIDLTKNELKILFEDTNGISSTETEIETAITTCSSIAGNLKTKRSLTVAEQRKLDGVCVQCGSKGEVRAGPSWWCLQHGLIF
jgi:hypothetical protein